SGGVGGGGGGEEGRTGAGAAGAAVAAAGPGGVGEKGPRPAADADRVAVRARATVLEREAGGDAVAELRRIGDAVDAGRARVTRHAVVRVAVRRGRVDVEVRPDLARREAGELGEAAIEEHRGDR